MDYARGYSSIARAAIMRMMYHLSFRLSYKDVTPKPSPAQMKAESVKGRAMHFMSRRPVSTERGEGRCATAIGRGKQASCLLC